MIGVSDSDQSIASKLEHVRAYIDDNLTESLALEELADLAGLSVFYFSRQFNSSDARRMTMLCVPASTWRGSISRRHRCPSRKSPSSADSG